MEMIEMLARMWMVCDPNRGGSDPDAVEPETVCSGGTGVPIVERANPLAGKPRWHWFIPRAEASLKFMEDNRYRVSVARDL